jgi:hypothetical protein
MLERTTSLPVYFSIEYRLLMTEMEIIHEELSVKNDLLPFSSVRTFIESYDKESLLGLLSGSEFISSLADSYARSAVNSIEEQDEIRQRLLNAAFSH